MCLSVNILFMILLLQCLVLCILQLGASTVQSQKSSKPRPLDCVVSVPSNGDKMPIPLVMSNTGKSSVIYPDEHGKFIVEHNSEFRMSCVGSNLTSPVGVGRQNVVTTCLNGSLVYDGKNYEFHQFKCERNPHPTLTLTNRRCAIVNNRVINIGFMTIFGFKILYKACFNVNYKSALFTWYFVNPPVNSYRQKSTFKPTFVHRDFKSHADSSDDNIEFTLSKDGLEMTYPRYEKIIIDVMEVYRNQTNRLEDILKSKKLADSYIKKDNSRRYIAPDHLIPTNDFVYSFQQNATHFYENTIPQWVSFSEDVWTEVEKLAMRNLAHANSTHLIVNGMYQISAFPDSFGEQKPFFLHQTERMPVPQFRWKMDYDISNKTGIVYLGMCNPYTPMDDTMHVCEPIPCPGFEHLSHATRKVVYCCTKESFSDVYYIDPILFREF